MKRAKNGAHPNEWRYPIIGAACVLALGLFAVGCGGKGSSPAATTAQNTTLTGSVGDGPIAGATITIYDGSNNVVTSKTMPANSYTYSISVPANTTLPITILASGGTDAVTGALQDFDLYSAVTAVTGTQTTANVSPITTMIMMTAKARAAVGTTFTTNDLDIARADVLKNMGFGLDANLVADPIATAITDAYQAATTIRANELMAEMIRRVTAGNAGTSASQVFENLAQDLSDGQRDGYAGANNPIANPAIFTTAASVSMNVLIEDAYGTLKITDNSGNTRVSAAGLLAKMDDALRAVNTLSAGVSMKTSDDPYNFERMKPQLALEAGLTRDAMYTSGGGVVSSYVTDIDSLLNSLKSINTDQYANPFNSFKAAVADVKIRIVDDPYVQTQVKSHADRVVGNSGFKAEANKRKVSAATAFVTAQIKTQTHSSSTVTLKKRLTNTQGLLATLVKSDPKNLETRINICTNKIAQMSSDPTLRSLLGKFTTNQGSTLPVQATIAAQLSLTSTQQQTTNSSAHWARMANFLTSNAADFTLLQDKGFDQVVNTLTTCIDTVQAAKDAGFSSQTIKMGRKSVQWDLADLNMLLSFMYGGRGAIQWSRSYNWNTDANGDGLPDVRTLTYSDTAGVYQYQLISTDPVAVLNDSNFFTLTGSAATLLPKALSDFHQAAVDRYSFLADMYANSSRNLDATHAFLGAYDRANLWRDAINAGKTKNWLTVGGDTLTGFANTRFKCLPPSVTGSGWSCSHNVSLTTRPKGTFDATKVFSATFDRSMFPTFAYADPRTKPLTKAVINPTLSKMVNAAIIELTAIGQHRSAIIVTKKTTYPNATLGGALIGTTVDKVNKKQL